MARRPVAAVVHDPDLVVVCDDGTVWSHQRDEDRWLRLAPIPGSPASRKKEEKDRKARKGRKFEVDAGIEDEVDIEDEIEALSLE
ncbi:hypothetical protein BH20GEM1_BH20GEM1_04720 [soil metagenome]